MISIKSTATLKTTMGFVLFLGILNFVVYFLVRFDLVSIKLLGLVNLDTEGNIPTFYATILLLAASAILLLIGLRDKKKYYWFLLSAIFCFLALDENISIHEQLTTLTKSAIGVEDPTIMPVAWIIPYGIMSILLALFFFKFVWNLPKKTKILFVPNFSLTEPTVPNSTLVEKIGDVFLILS